jgi:hypothetical protein
LFYYGLLGYTEIESKLSSMIRHGLISRDTAMERINSYRIKMQSAKTEVNQLCVEIGMEHLIPLIDDFCKKSAFIID